MFLMAVRSTTMLLYWLFLIPKYFVFESVMIFV